MEVNRLNQISFGTAAAILSALCMLFLGIFGALGHMKDAVEFMMRVHYFFSLTPAGIILGAIEGAVHGFIYGFLFAFFYNHCPFNK